MPCNEYLAESLKLAAAGRRAARIPNPSFRYVPDPKTIAEREVAYSMPLTIEQRLLGDPLLGRSALERKRRNEPSRLDDV
jgi:hypothetical protein